MNSDQLSKLLHALGTGIRKPLCPYKGICHEIAEREGTGALPQGTYEAVRSLMHRWPEGSGERGYPVDHPTIGPDAYSEVAEKWDPTKVSCSNDKKYIKNRLKLCCWLAENVKTDEKLVQLFKNG